ncbi:MAG: hypothetical protein J7K04_04115 [Spirochaetales bacterium]|nr:hypothetical protein [Spirochaetales bacterium]
MKIMIFSDQVENYKNNLPLKTKPAFQVAYYNLKELKTILRKADNEILVYAEIPSRETGKAITCYLSKKAALFWAVIDLNKVYEDPAELFHLGAVDYVSENNLLTGNFRKRINRILKYLKKYRNFSEIIGEQTALKENLKIPADGWNSIRVGKEYTFFIMYIELDGKEDFEKKWGKLNLDRAIGTFKRYVERVSRQFNGRLWIWSGFNGIILFPFDGKKGDAILCGFRLYLFKNIFDVEESLFPNFISFRTAIHFGSMTYKRNETGHIISDTINSIFHLGKRFVKAGDFCVTEDAFRYSPEALKDYFKKTGEYEGRLIYTLKHVKEY